MKKSFLFLFIATLAIITACEKDPVIEATPPVGYWDELFWIPILETGATAPDMKQLTWAEMVKAHTAGTVNLDTLKYVVQEIRFIHDTDVTGIMRITIHYGDTRSVPNDCRAEEAPSLTAARTEYLEIRYTISEGTSQDIGIISAQSGRYTGRNFGATEPASSCSPTGYINPADFVYEFSYEDKDRKRMRLVHIVPPEKVEEKGIRSIHILEKRPE